MTSPLSPAPKGAVTTDSTKIELRSIRFEGNTLISGSTLQESVQSYFGRTITLAELQEAMGQIRSVYSRTGYLADAVIPPQQIVDGVVVIQVIEARLGKVVVEQEAGARLSAERATKLVTTTQPEGQLVRLSRFERGIRLLQSTPGAQTSVLVRPGMVPSTVDAVVFMKRAPLLTGMVGYDSYGSRSAGEHRLNAEANLESPLCIGDRLSVRYVHSDGLDYGRLVYLMPLGSSGLRAGVSGSWMAYGLGRELVSLDAKGDALTLGGFLTMPIITGRQASLWGFGSYDYKQYRDEQLAIRTDDKRLQSWSIGLSGGWGDHLLGEAWNSAGATVGLGQVDLSHNPDEGKSDEQTAGTAGNYSKLSLNFSRDQSLPLKDLRLYLSTTGQFSSGNLDSSEQFYLGGPYGVRAYPVSEGSGDFGLLCTVELRWRPIPKVQLAGFYDWGRIRQHADPWPDWQSTPEEPNNYGLDGFGACVTLQPLDGLSLKGTIAMRNGPNPLADAEGYDHDGTKRDPRYWIEATWQF